MLDIYPKVWNSVLWIGIALVFLCVLSRFMYIAAAIQSTGNCNTLILQAITSLFTLVVEFMLYMDVPNFFLNALYKLAPVFFLGKSFDSLDSKLSTLRNSAYFHSGGKSSKYNTLIGSPLTMKEEQ